MKITVHRYDGYIVGESKVRNSSLILSLDGKAGTVLIRNLPRVRIDHSGSESQEVQLGCVKFWTDENRVFVTCPQSENVRIGDYIDFRDLKLHITP